MNMTWNYTAWNYTAWNYTEGRYMYPYEWAAIWADAHHFHDMTRAKAHAWVKAMVDQGAPITLELAEKTAAIAVPDEFEADGYLKMVVISGRGTFTFAAMQRYSKLMGVPY